MALDGKRPEQKWTASNLSELLGGKWINRPSDDWSVMDFVIDKASIAISENMFREMSPPINHETMFIAMDEKTFLKGSGNTGVYGSWEDTHNHVKPVEHMLKGVIAQHEIEDLDKNFPQLIIENTYDAIRVLSAYARENIDSNVIAVTGTAGKSTTCSLIKHIITGEKNLFYTRGNHNTRTGINLHLASSFFNPDVILLEVAISSLWMKTRSISSEMKPKICVITAIGLGQVGDYVNSEHDTAVIKSKVCEGIEPGGYAVLNREMLEFETVLQEVEKYGATPITYGFSEDSDIRILSCQPNQNGSDVVVDLMGKVFSYFLPIPGEAMTLNSAASLAVAHLLGLNAEMLSQKFAFFATGKNVLEYLQVPIGKGSFTVLDDSHNSEIISMIEAIKVAKRISIDSNGKKIAILGRIVNLGEMSKELHLKLVDPIIESGIDMVFLHGEEMRVVAENLPPSIVGGLFKTAKECVNAAASFISTGDFVLIKGSRRASDFGQIPKELVNYFRELRQIRRHSNLDYAANHPSVAVLDLSTSEMIYKHDPKSVEVHEGLGNIMLIHLVLEMLDKGEVVLTDQVKGGSWFEFEKKYSNSLGIKENESIDFYTAISSFIIGGAADGALAVSDLIAKKNSQKTSRLLDKIASQADVGDHTHKNITGRKTKELQTYNIDDMAKLSILLFNHPHSSLTLLSNDLCVGKGKLFKTKSALLSSGEIAYGYFFGQHTFNAVVYKVMNHVPYVICVCNARNGFHRDYLISKCIVDLGVNSQEDKKREEEILPTGNGKEYVINIGGDVYFGEYYSQERQKLNIEDGLSKFGYSHSIEKIVPVFEHSSYNIVNLECAFTDHYNTPYKGVSPYILPADASKTVQALKELNVHAATLATNHIMDFGEPGIIKTMEALKDAKIAYVGGGYHVNDAERPLHLKFDGFNVYIFNFYNYRVFRHLKTAYYAISNRPGAACGQGGILENIKKYRENDKSSFIIAIPHWGTDYVSIGNEERKLAKDIIDAGADIIIGHGPHIVSQTEWINNKLVHYSLGNFIFNSNGEFRRRHIQSLAFLAQLRFSGDSRHLRLYLLQAENHKTFWQPRPITEQEFKTNYENYILNLNRHTDYKLKVDDFGYFLEYDISK